MLKKTVLSTSVFVYCCQPWFSLDFCAPIRIQGYLKAIADGSVCGKLLKDNREGEHGGQSKTPAAHFRILCIDFIMKQTITVI